jgi:diaminopimelate dehydrogenase
MRPRRLAVVGFGKLGRACAEAIVATEDLRLAGVVRRAERLDAALPSGLEDVQATVDIGDLDAVDAALLCVPPQLVTTTAHDLLQHRIPVVECAVLQGENVRVRKERLHRLAQRHHVTAVLGAGWDPGALSLLRGLFTLLVPKGHTGTTDRPGVSLHHTLSARSVAGVRDALCTELRSAEGKVQRYVYVELTPGADAQRVVDAIRSEPLFLEEETLVFPVESVAALEEEGRGVVLERRGTAGGTGHQMLLFEARFDLWCLAAQVMIAAARSLPDLPPGAYALSEVPLNLLFGAESMAFGREAI